MITLHSKQGQISGQIHKRLEDVSQLADNLNLVSGCQWQSLFKFRSSGIGSVPIVYSFALNLHDSAIKEPYTFELSEGEARQKLKGWNFSAVEIEKLLKTEVE